MPRGDNIPFTSHAPAHAAQAYPVYAARRSDPSGALEALIDSWETPLQARDMPPPKVVSITKSPPRKAPARAASSSSLMLGPGASSWLVEVAMLADTPATTYATVGGGPRRRSA